MPDRDELTFCPLVRTPGATLTAENPIRHGRLPANIIEAARVVLDAGAKTDRSILESTLALVASGRVARECGAQVPLIDLLCDHGADPDRAWRSRALDSMVRPCRPSTCQPSRPLTS